MGLLAKIVTSILYATLKVEIKGQVELIVMPGSPLIVAAWHDKLLFVPLLIKLRRSRCLSIVISKSRDGRLLAAFARTFRNVETILVGHKSRHGALLQMVQALHSDKVLLITPDGPRGPRHQVKDGLLFCAEKSDAAILAMQASCSSYWTLNTWDKMQIPKPFSKVTITLQVTKDRTKEAIEEALSS